jgi:hypothetical protein
MRKSSFAATWAAVLTLMGVLLGLTRPARAADTPTTTDSALSNTLVERAEAELTRTKALVDKGALPVSRIAEAEDKLADARDEALLAVTLYGQPRVQDMTPEQATSMLASAQRRVERQQQAVERRKQLLDMGILSQSEFAVGQDELESRRRVLSLVQNRIQLMNELRELVESEERFEHLSLMASAGLRGVMIRYDGSGPFQLTDLAKISSIFEQHFHRPLPVSAMGETALHRSMGLDHRNRVDVALNPDSTEGLWLREFLEQHRVPYLAFRGALAGAATAPHIHIGLGSTRLKLASR